MESTLGFRRDILTLLKDCMEHHSQGEHAFNTILVQFPYGMMLINVINLDTC